MRKKKFDEEITDIKDDKLLVFIREIRDELKLIREKIEEQIDLVKKIKEEI